MKVRTLSRKRDCSLVKCDMDMIINFGMGWETLRYNLINALCRLPEEIYVFTTENIYFNSSHSSTVPLKEVSKPFMVILNKSDSQSVIAHEIAHAYLNHHLSSGIGDKQEEKAEELRKKWGFRAKIPNCFGYPKECYHCFTVNCPNSLASKK